MIFFDWNALGSFAGSALAVAVLTQMTKELPLLCRLPTQLWSYLLALATLTLSAVFGADGFDMGGFALSLFNAALTSLAANGGYGAIQRIQKGLEADQG